MAREFQNRKIKHANNKKFARSSLKTNAPHSEVQKKPEGASSKPSAVKQRV